MCRTDDAPDALCPWSLQSENADPEAWIGVHMAWFPQDKHDNLSCN
jgi:hypothetical protein